MRRLKEDRGATLVMVVFLFGVFLGAMALVIDLGSWFHSQRSLQAAADAAALAGAQDLPNTATASTTATNYANNNYGSANIGTKTITFAADNSWIDVTLKTTALPEFFAKFLHVPAPTASAHARASVGSPGTIKGAVPIVVTQSQVCLTNSTGCFNVQKDLNFDPLDVTSSKFGLVDLQGNSATSTTCTGSSSANLLKTWIATGLQAFLGINRWYCVATNGEDTSIGNTMTANTNKPLLVPVYDTVNPTGGTAGKGSFHVLGWAAFVIDSVVSWRPNNKPCEPNCKVLRGHFIQYIVHDVVSVPGVGGGGFGVKIINLSQ